MEAGRAQVQAGLLTPLQEAVAHPGVAVTGLPHQEAAIGLLLAADHLAAATGHLHLAVAADHHTAAEVVADLPLPPVAADHLPVAVAGPAVEEDNSRFILSRIRKIDFVLVQVKYI